MSDVDRVSIAKAAVEIARNDLASWEASHGSFFGKFEAVERQNLVSALEHAKRMQVEALRDASSRAPSAREAAEALGRPGPRPMVTRSQVEAKRHELEVAGKPSGERSIAKELSVSRDAVRYAEGKDRRRR